jgi:hypothetical protein
METPFLELRNSGNSGALSTLRESDWEIFLSNQIVKLIIISASAASMSNNFHSFVPNFELENMNIDDKIKEHLSLLSSTLSFSIPVVLGLIFTSTHEGSATFEILSLAVNIDSLRILFLGLPIILYLNVWRSLRGIKILTIDARDESEENLCSNSSFFNPFYSFGADKDYFDYFGILNKFILLSTVLSPLLISFKLFHTKEAHFGGSIFFILGFMCAIIMRNIRSIDRQLDRSNKMHRNNTRIATFLSMTLLILSYYLVLIEKFAFSPN